MNNLNEYLQKLRNKSQLSQVDVANGFKKRGYNVTNQMIYNWESGRIRISGELLLVFCDILHIQDIRAAFDMKEVPSLLSELDDKGVKMVSDYADLIRASGLYKKKIADVIPFEPRIINLSGYPYIFYMFHSKILFCKHYLYLHYQVYSRIVLYIIVYDSILISTPCISEKLTLIDHVF